MVNQYFNGIARGLSYLRNAPHMYGLTPLRGPRLTGYVTAAASAVGGATIGGWAGDQIFDGIAGFLSWFHGNPVSAGAANSIEDVAAFIMPLGVVAGAAAGVRAGAAAGRWTADMYTRLFENRTDVTDRVRNFYADPPNNITGRALDTATRRYVNELYR